MFRNRLVCAALVLGCAPLLVEVGNALVREPVEGAFGMRLGAEFIPNEALHDSTTINGQRAYYFSPVVQSRFFDFYLVQITPVRHLIHTIIAVGQTDDRETCHQHRAALMPTLREKYGPSTKDGPVQAADFDMDHEVIVQADHKRGVGVICGGTSPIIFQVIYLDDELSDLALEERLPFAQEAKLRL